MFTALNFKRAKVKNNLTKLVKKVINIAVEAIPEPTNLDSTTELIFKIRIQNIKKKRFIKCANSKT